MLIQEVSSPLIYPWAPKYWSYCNCSHSSPHLQPPQLVGSLGDQQDSFTIIINSWPLSENRENRGKPSQRVARVPRPTARRAVPASPAMHSPGLPFPSPAPNQLTQ